MINVFCLSTQHDSKLYEEFDSDCCIEILDPNEFIKKTKIAVKKLISAHKTGLLHREVIYYQDNAPASFDIKNPKNLAFAKGVYYQHQQEYRLVFGNKKAFDLVQQIVSNGSYDFIAEAKKGIPKEKHMYIGKLNGIVKVHYT